MSEHKENKNTYVWKQLADFYDKYYSAIKLMAFLSPLAFAIWEYLMTYIDVPKRIDSIELHQSNQRKQDSLKAVFYMSKIDSIERVCNRYKRKLYRDSLSIDKIKTKLKIN